MPLTATFDLLDLESTVFQNRNIHQLKPTFHNLCKKVDRLVHLCSSQFSFSNNLLVLLLTNRLKYNSITIQNFFVTLKKTSVLTKSFTIISILISGYEKSIRTAEPLQIVQKVKWKCWVEASFTHFR